MKMKKNQIEQNIRSFSLNKKSEFDDEKLAILGVVISNGNEDSYGTTFNPDGINIKRFSKNPVLIYNHRAHDDALPIGHVENIRRGEGTEVLADVYFESVTKNSRGKDIYNLFKVKALNGFSIRFNPLKFGDEKNNEYTFEEWELVEVSVVVLPSNETAIVKRNLAKDSREEQEIQANQEAPEDEVKPEEIRNIITQTFSKLRKIDNDKEEAQEIKEQFTTDIRAALVDSYKTLGKSLKSLKNN